MQAAPFGQPTHVPPVLQNKNLEDIVCTLSHTSKAFGHHKPLLFYINFSAFHCSWKSSSVESKTYWMYVKSCLFGRQAVCLSWQISLDMCSVHTNFKNPPDLPCLQAWLAWTVLYHLHLPWNCLGVTFQNDQDEHLIWCWSHSSFNILILFWSKMKFTWCINKLILFWSKMKFTWCINKLFLTSLSMLPHFRVCGVFFFFFFFSCFCVFKLTLNLFHM